MRPSLQPKKQSLQPNKEAIETVKNLNGKYNNSIIKSYFIRVLIIISCMILILYYNSLETNPVNQNAKQNEALLKMVDKYDFQEFIDTIQSPRLTQLQKENLFDSSIGKYIKGKGIVLDVTRNGVILSTNIGNSNRAPDLELIVSKGYLYKLPDINKGVQITFLGEISKESNMLNGTTAKLIDGRIQSITKFGS